MTVTTAETAAIFLSLLLKNGLPHFEQVPQGLDENESGQVLHLTHICDIETQ